MVNQPVSNVSTRTLPPTPPFQLTGDQVAEYENNGLIFLDQLFSAEEVVAIRAALPAVLAERTERTVFEVDGQTIRSVYGVHQIHRLFADLARHPRLLGPVREALKSEVYLYQSKLNTKAVFGGDVWPWHQDYIFWRNEDGMPTPRALTLAVFLDDVTEHNGPLSLIPGSHHHGVVATNTYEGQPEGYGMAPTWISNLTAKLKYTITQEAFVELATKYGIVTPKGRAGSVLLFDGNVAHASSSNLSPFERTMVLFTYNAVDNLPGPADVHRPDFLVSRDVAPLTPVVDDLLRSNTSADPS